MKTLIFFSAFLVALSSCSKEMPVPAPDSDPVYTSDPDPDSDVPPDPDPDPDDDNDDDPSPYATHPGSSTVHWKTATNLNKVH